MAQLPALGSANTGSATAVVRRHVLAFLAYAGVAVAFFWPLPLHLTTALPGPVLGDTGVYIWNLWVFRHAIVAHREMPFFTTEILSLSPALPLTLQNYTTLANVIAFPLLPLLGIVATFNVLVIAAGVMSAHAMFICARRLTGDTAASWVAGLAFGFSPYMSARAMEHFSLVQTAPLPIFVMLFDRLHFARHRASPSPPASPSPVPFSATRIRGVLPADRRVCDRLFRGPHPARAGGCVPPVSRNPGTRCRPGLPRRSDCGHASRRRPPHRDPHGPHQHDPALHTGPALHRSRARPRLDGRPHARVLGVPDDAAVGPALIVAGAACAVLLSPVLSAMVGAMGESQWTRPTVYWQSSAPGLDLFALFVQIRLPPVVRPILRRRRTADAGRVGREHRIDSMDADRRPPDGGGLWPRGAAALLDGLHGAGRHAGSRALCRIGG